MLYKSVNGNLMPVQGWIYNGSFGRGGDEIRLSLYLELNLNLVGFHVI